MPGQPTLFCNMLDIRRVDSSELGLLLEFAERTFRVAFQQLNDPRAFELYCSTVFTPEHFQAQFDNPLAQFWFVFSDNRLAAYFKLNLDVAPAGMDAPRGTQVERLYVDAAFQGQRIGEQMLHHTEEQARGRKEEWVWLSTWKKVPAAIRFYQRCGYEIFGEEVFWVGDDPQMDWLMRKRVM